MKQIRQVRKNPRPLKKSGKAYWLLLTPVLFSSCYSVSIATQYLCLVGRAKPFEKVQEPSAKEQQLFERVQKIKSFSERVLGLRVTQNYSRYVRLERNYLSAVISAAPALGFTDYLWSYPVVGELPYRGYFSVPKAQKEAQHLKDSGYDVFIRSVNAFSTLGYVRDPLFSFMANYSEAELANLIIHESFHATVFLRGDIALNESLANLVGNYGSELYLGSKSGKSAVKEGSKQDRQQFRHMIFEIKERLQQLYDNPGLTEAEKLKAKSELITKWQQQFQEPEYSKYFQGPSYRYIEEFPINNAYLALFSLYEDPDNFLEDIYQSFVQGGDTLEQFIALCRKLAKETKVFKGKKAGPRMRQALRQYQQSL